MFFDIINKAIAVMKGGGILTIATRLIIDEGRRVEVRISDTGTAFLITFPVKT